jgi:uroporphyrinogen-III synthase
LKEFGVEAIAVGLQKIVVSDAHRIQTSVAQRQLALFDTVVFVSPNAVDVFFDQAFIVPYAANLCWLCVGQATAQALRQQLPLANHGSIICGASNDADAVLVLLNSLRNEIYSTTSSQLANRSASKFLKILVVRGTSGRDDWILACQQAGDQVEVLSAYASIEQSPDRAVFERLTASQAVQKSGGDSPVVFVVASTQLAAQLFKWLSAESPELAQWALRQTSFAIHPRIVDRLESFGFVAPKLISPGVQGIVEGLK